MGKDPWLRKPHSPLTYYGSAQMVSVGSCLWGCPHRTVGPPSSAVNASVAFLTTSQKDTQSISRKEPPSRNGRSSISRFVTSTN